MLTNKITLDLDASREYVISVRAHNHAGNGFPMYESVRTLSTSAAASNMHSHEDDYDYENIDGAPLVSRFFSKALLVLNNLFHCLSFFQKNFHSTFLV